MLTLAAVWVAIHAHPSPIITPYRKKTPLAITSIRPLTLEAKVFEIKEFVVDLGATYDNPFDPTDVSLDAMVVSPKHLKYTVPGFLYRPYVRSMKDGKETLIGKGQPEWRVRVCPTEAGEYAVTVTLKDRTGLIASSPVHFRAKASDVHGFVRVSPRDHKYFEYSDGTSYYPIGANICWGGDRGTYNYDEWISDYANVGANYMRVFLDPGWVTFAIEQKGKPEEGKGMGQFDLANSWRLDYALERASAGGMNVMLTIDSFNELRAHNFYPEWDNAPQNLANGGPLKSWTDYWTDPKMDLFYKAKLRYLVARYSAFQNVMSWEFWNEVDGIEDYNADVVRSWHQRTGDFLRSLDPYHHLVTTSFSEAAGNPKIDLLSEIDYNQTHMYDNPDVAGGVLFQQTRKADRGKPHYFGEIGADSTGPRTNEDPGGLQIHDPQWMSVATGSSGTAMAWFWDNLIAPKNLYPLFGAIARFTKGVDWPGEDFRPVEPQVEYGQPPKTTERKDLVFENGPVQWVDGESNKPHLVTVVGGKPQGNLPLPGIQHGIRNHPTWHNPISFKVSLERPVRFEAIVGVVSGYGGATLQISIDGNPELTRDFPAPGDGSQGGTLTKYEAHYGVLVPAGRHTVTVENIGTDWFMADYRFVELIDRTGPPLQAWAIRGKNTVLMWIRQDGRTWRRVIVDKKPFPAVPPSVIGLDGLSAGDWRLEIWDTWKGMPTSKSIIHVDSSGKVHLPVPGITSDLAVKMVKVI